jgi:hypothetical protein
MYMRIFYFIFFCIIFTFFSCKFNPNVQGRGAIYLQGIWSEEQVLYQDQLLEYTLHTFKFTCDSFYLTLDTHAKANMYPDSCFNNGRWTEYVKGVYSVSNDTLSLNGTFTKSNFKQKISGCYHIGQYVKTFALKKCKNDSLSLRDMSQHVSFSLRLRQRINCIPKSINWNTYDVTTQYQRASWAERHFSNWLFDFYQVPKAILINCTLKYNYDGISTFNQQLLQRMGCVWWLC